MTDIRYLISGGCISAACNTTSVYQDGVVMADSTHRLYIQSHMNGRDCAFLFLVFGCG